MNFFLLLIIGISLSMDAFSLSIIYGTLQSNYKSNFILSCIVGLFHFFMPLFGLLFGNIITKYINMSYATGFIFLVIGISMIIDSFKSDKEGKILRIFEMFGFAFAVSIDSFSLGVGLNSITNNYILASLIFSFCSFIFTLFGLTMGGKLSSKVGNISIFLGGMVLSSIGLISWFN